MRRQRTPLSKGTSRRLEQAVKLGRGIPFHSMVDDPMPYTVQLNESTYLGRTLSCDVAEERFDNVAAASAAAKNEAFHLSVQLGVAVAIRIFEDRRIFLSHIMPAPQR